ncbi:MAG: hypothetical protein GTO22_10555 [Gemmatimonadales bacterium]|nr:hypothetical protein [Gemmatimonadales bacterium]
MGALVALTIVGAFGLVGVTTWLAMRSVRRSQVGREELQRLSQAVDGLQEQLFEIRDAVGDVHERLMFTERLLAKGDAKAAAPVQSPTPV